MRIIRGLASVFFVDTSSEIDSCIEQAENCLNLIVSKEEKSSIPPMTNQLLEDDDDDDDDDDDFIDVPLNPKPNNDQELLQILGLGTAGKLNITINLNDRPTSSLFDIKTTEDNRALVENLHDLYRQLNDVYLTKIQSWMNLFIKAQQNSTTAVMKRAIDLKNSIKSCLKMIENYHLAPVRIKAIEKPGSIPSKKKIVVQSSPIESVSVISNKECFDE